MRELKCDRCGKSEGKFLNLGVTESDNNAMLCLNCVVSSLDELYGACQTVLECGSVINQSWIDKVKEAVTHVKGEIYK